MEFSKVRLVVAGVVAATSFGFLGAGTAYAIQLHMVNARSDLTRGLTELQQALPDKGGHREQAISLVEQALDQVNQSIENIDSDNQPTPSTAAPAPAAPATGTPGL